MVMVIRMSHGTWGTWLAVLIAMAAAGCGITTTALELVDMEFSTGHRVERDPVDLAQARVAMMAMSFGDLRVRCSKQAAIRVREIDEHYGLGWKGIMLLSIAAEAGISFTAFKNDEPLLGTVALLDGALAMTWLVMRRAREVVIETPGWALWDECPPGYGVAMETELLPLDDGGYLGMMDRRRFADAVAAGTPIAFIAGARRIELGLDPRERCAIARGESTVEAPECVDRAQPPFAEPSASPVPPQQGIVVLLEEPSAIVRIPMLPPKQQPQSESTEEAQ